MSIRLCAKPAAAATFRFDILGHRIRYLSVCYLLAGQFKALSNVRLFKVRKSTFLNEQVDSLCFRVFDVNRFAEAGENHLALLWSQLKV